MEKNNDHGKVYFFQGILAESARKTLEKSYFLEFANFLFLIFSFGGKLKSICFNNISYIQK